MTLPPPPSQRVCGLRAPTVLGAVWLPLGSLGPSPPAASEPERGPGRRLVASPQLFRDTQESAQSEAGRLSVPAERSFAVQELGSALSGQGWASRPAELTAFLVVPGSEGAWTDSVGFGWKGLSL